MYTCLSLSIHIYIHIHTSLSLSIYIYKCTCMYIYIYIYIHIDPAGVLQDGAEPAAEPAVPAYMLLIIINNTTIAMNNQVNI